VRGFFKNETVRAVGAGVVLAATGLLDLLYPSFCERCGTRLAAGIPLCPLCVQLIERVDPVELESMLNRLDRPVLASLFALWYFDRDSTVRRIQHQLKYGNRPRMGHWFGRMLGNEWLREGRSIPEIVIPIPLHRTRIIERGYNQSAMIADGFASVVCATVRTDILKRTRATQSQTRLSRNSRQGNVTGVFSADTGQVFTSALIVDDVLTTGATLNEAARALIEAGHGPMAAAAIGLARN
jgi:ComF family protein